ncbi:MAG: POT family MFS transporter [Deltaproteobacteria bacterium]|nr:MAG: POT family MFS transporter [Deltaproteobacteria bacterium]TMQ24077.1 MAG: POT family MFS transporter [Deltaproteobacteria bacterium]
MSDAIPVEIGRDFIPATNPVVRLRQHPSGFWFVLWGELAERASFYGMRTLLVLYMVDVLAFSQAGGTTVMKAFSAACFLTPFLGGWIADRRLGAYRTILYFCLPYVLGHIVLGASQSTPGLFAALVLLAIGSGALKPNASVLLARIYDAEGKTALLSEAFSLFYAMGNLGGAAAAIALPLVVKVRGGQYGMALAMPALLMALAFGIFAAGKRRYPDDAVPPPRPSEPRRRAVERRTLLHIAGVFGCIAIFWLVYGQNADTWVYFAHSHTDLHVLGGIAVTANQTQALNPLLIVLLTPVFNWIWNVVKRRRGGREVPETQKMLFGYVVVVIASAIMAYAGWLARSGTPVTVWWILVATALMALAELCIVPVGLIFAYRHAAAGTKSVIVAAFHMMAFLGSMIGLSFAPFYENGLDPAAYFALLAAVMVAMTFVFVPISGHGIDSRRPK